ncbi:hypothetical protein GCM10027049_04850 [Mucilaginibacter puniceus]
MEDTAGGKNCRQCQKKVFDLTNCSQDEMDIILIQNNYNICARFNEGQLATKSSLKRWASAAIILLGFNLLNSKAVAQNAKVIDTASKFNYTPIPKGFLGEVSITSYDSMPKFPGGIEALNVFLEQNLNFTDSEADVYVQFNIDTLGIVKNFRVIQGMKTVSEEDAAKIVKLSPQWIPAMQNGKPVQLNYTLHIAFKKVPSK